MPAEAGEAGEGAGGAGEAGEAGEGAGGAGERVVEVSAFVAAPLAGMTLAGLGCDVLRVDPPGGGLDFARWPVTSAGESIFWAGLNRGKRSVVIDFRLQEGRELVSALVLAGGEEGGVLLTNLGARGSLSYESLSRRRGDVISIEIEGYPDGSSAVDYTLAARTGIPQLAGGVAEDGPVNSPFPAWDVATGLSAVIAAREVMQRRRRNGTGGRVRVALADVALGVLASLGFLDEARRAAEPRQRDGNYLYGAFGRDFVLDGGARVMIVAITPKQWGALVAALDMAGEVAELEHRRGLDLDREGDRFHARHEVARLIEVWCASKVRAEVQRRFDQHGVCYEFYASAPELLAALHQRPADDDAHRDAADSGLVVDLGLPFRFGNEESAPLGPAPRLGADTEEALGGLLGLSQLEIGRLRDAGLVVLAGAD